MTEEMTNYEKLQAAAKLMSKMIRLEERYRIGKIALEDGGDLDIPADRITALKQRFAAVRTEHIALLESVAP